MKTRINYTLASILCLLHYISASPQTPVQQFQANYITAPSTILNYTDYPNNPGTFSGCVATQYNYTWSNGTDNQLKLASFTANAKTFVVAGVSNVQVKLRRVNNSNVSGERAILYSESTAATAIACSSPRSLDFKAPYNHDMAGFLNNSVLNHGTDNLFTNTGNGDGNVNNIERVDVLFPSGISSAYPADAGFVLCERGANNGHDGFRIVAILGLDGSGNPSSFGGVKTCVAGNGSNNGSWGHPSVANGNRQLAAYVLRKDQADPYLKVSSNVNQELGAVFFSLADLGIAKGQVIFGYSLLSLDGIALPTSSQLLNLTNSTVYPLNTTEAAGGGLDLISVNTFFGTNQALASSHIKSINATISGSTVNLSWEINSLQSGKMISLERSFNGTDFTSIYQYGHDGQDAKSYRDNPGKAKIYYRLKINMGPGYEYSSVVFLQLKTVEDFEILPSVSSPGGTLVVKYGKDGRFVFKLFTASGNLVANMECSIQDGKASVKVPATLVTGIYVGILESRGINLIGNQKVYIR